MEYRLGFGGACGNRRALTTLFSNAAFGTSGTLGTLGTGLISYATRLTLSRCRGVMLSDVMLPPKPPHPRVMGGARPVGKPIAPRVLGVLTQMRYAGL